MQPLIFQSIFFALLLNAVATSVACKGCLNLDEVSFDKIVPKFKAALVKFDVSYPYGDKHDVFTKLADEVAPLQDLVVAEVGVKDYGDKDNEALAESHGFKKDDLPAIKLFVSGKSPVTFSKNADWTVENIRNLIRDNTDIYIGLPGCLEAFDGIAAEFARSGDKEAVIKKAEKVATSMQERDKETAKIYIKFMRKIVENGSNFVAQETNRLHKILKDGKINEKKKIELENRVNILRSFSVIKDEL